MTLGIRDTQEMARLYQSTDLTMEQIGERYGIIKQAVHARFVRAGIPRRRRHQTINKERLKKLYEAGLSLKKIGKRFGTDAKVIRQSLKFHKIAKRPPVKFGGKNVNFLRTLKVNQKKKIVTDVKYPHAALHRSAKAINLRISVRTVGENEFQVTRIE